MGSKKEEKQETIEDIVRELDTIADNMEKAAKSVNIERMQYATCRVHKYCYKHEDLMREARDTRRLSSRIKAAIKRERQSATL